MPRRVYNHEPMADSRPTSPRHKILTTNKPIQTLEAQLQSALTAAQVDPTTVERCVKQWLIKDRYVHHEYVPQLHAQTTADLPPDAAANFHRAVLLSLSRHTLAHGLAAGTMRTLQLAEISRIVDDCARQPDAYFQLNKKRNPLEKDLSLSAGRSLVIGGAWMVEQRCVNPYPSSHTRLWQPRRMQMLRHVFGRQPECFVVHTLERRIRHFKAAEHEQAMRNLAQHLATTSLAGVYRESWFLDPEVSRLSPSIAFLAALPVENGAQLKFKQDADADMSADALDKSPQRKAAYNAGDYTPRIYAYFWPRKAVLNWLLSGN